MNKTRIYNPNPSSSSSLDSQKTNRNKFCGLWTVGRTVEEGDHTERHYARLTCKRWKCSRCGPKRVTQLRRAIIEAAQEKHLTRFLTLTLNPSRCLAKDSLPYIRNCWNKFRTYLRRYCEMTISFIAIVEFQKSGYAHLHILIDRFIRQDWISEAWQAVGGGKIVFIKQVSIQRIGPYLTKYLTKELMLNGFKKHQRRYSTSEDVDLLVKKCAEKWDLVKLPIESVHRQLSTLIVDEAHDSEGRLERIRARYPSKTFDSTLRSASGDAIAKATQEI